MGKKRDINPVSRKKHLYQDDNFDKIERFFYTSFFLVGFVENGQKITFQNKIQEKLPVPERKFLQNVTFLSYGTSSFLGRFFSKTMGKN